MRVAKIIIVTMLAAVAVFLTVSSGKAVATATCSDSWGNDGQSGPWFTVSNGNDVLHGNTLDISCPGSGTAWKVQYYVYVISGGHTTTPINVTRSGNGSTSFSISLNPYPCPSPADAYTKAHNYYTGGDISKPSSHDQVLC